MPTSPDFNFLDEKPEEKLKLAEELAVFATFNPTGSRNGMGRHRRSWRSKRNGRR